MTERSALLDVADVTPGQALPAGPFGRWLDAMDGALAKDTGMDVPCGSCTACCRSRYFVHIGANETDTLDHVPPELRFPAPGGRGDQVMGFDQHGCCPMLREDGCAIYDHRPLTCRRFDCRVFTASGLDPSADDRPAIGERVRRWRFTYPQPAERKRQAAIQAAAAFLLAHAPELGSLAPGNLTQTAVLAVRLRQCFDAAGSPDHQPDTAALMARVRVELEASRVASPGR